MRRRVSNIAAQVVALGPVRPDGPDPRRWQWSCKRRVKSSSPRTSRVARGRGLRVGVLDADSGPRWARCGRAWPRRPGRREGVEPPSPPRDPVLSMDFYSPGRHTLCDPPPGRGPHLRGTMDDGPASSLPTRLWRARRSPDRLLRAPDGFRRSRFARATARRGHDSSGVLPPGRAPPDARRERGRGSSAGRELAGTCFLLGAVCALRGPGRERRPPSTACPPRRVRRPALAAAADAGLPCPRPRGAPAACAAGLRARSRRPRAHVRAACASRETARE